MMPEGGWLLVQRVRGERRKDTYEGDVKDRKAT